MPINISVPDLAELKPRITVFGVGGGGCNAVNNMINSNLQGVEFVVANTDAQALANSPCERKIQMGVSITQGLGAGSQPEVGARAAEETKSEIIDHLAGSHMVFVTAGMGGGTGTGAAPVIAALAREQGILTVGVVTKPFNFEGRRRMAIAESGINTLAQHVDTLIVIPNQNLFRVANEATSFTAAFQMADQVLYSGVASITELMTREGLINLDFADVRAVMSDMGKAMMGTGEASGENRAEEAALAAISNPLLDIDSMAGARGVLISIAGGPDLTLYEVDQAASRIREEVDPEANIIVGATIEEELEGTMRVSVVATGLQQEAHEQAAPQGQGTHNGVSTVSGVAGVQVPGVGGCIYPAAGSTSPQPERRTTQSAELRAGSQNETPETQPRPADPETQQTAQPHETAGGAEPVSEAEAQPSPEIAPSTQQPQEVPLQEAQPRSQQPAGTAPQENDAARNGQPAHGGRETSIPTVEDLPPVIRHMAEKKQERIRMLGDAAATPPAAGGRRLQTGPENGQGKRRNLFIGKVKELFGRGQSAPQVQPAVPPRPDAQAVTAAGHAGAGSVQPIGSTMATQNADTSPLADDDGLNIPAFLRRSR